jgi:excisionase family DNA binding protein
VPSSIRQYPLVTASIGSSSGTKSDRVVVGVWRVYLPKPMASRTRHSSAEDEPLPLLTIEEAARYLGISRSLAYALAAEYLDSGGMAGLPVIRFGTCLRVPRWALIELATTGNVVRLGAGAVHVGDKRGR